MTEEERGRRTAGVRVWMARLVRWAWAARQDSAGAMGLGGAARSGGMAGERGAGAPQTPCNVRRVGRWPGLHRRRAWRFDERGQDPMQQPATGQPGGGDGAAGRRGAGAGTGAGRAARLEERGQDPMQRCTGPRPVVEDGAAGRRGAGAGTGAGRAARREERGQDPMQQPATGPQPGGGAVAQTGGAADGRNRLGHDGARGDAGQPGAGVEGTASSAGAMGLGGTAGERGAGAPQPHAT